MQSGLFINQLCPALLLRHRRFYFFFFFFFFFINYYYHYYHYIYLEQKYGKHANELDKP